MQREDQDAEFGESVDGCRSELSLREGREGILRSTESMGRSACSRKAPRLAPEGVADRVCLSRCDIGNAPLQDSAIEAKLDITKTAAARRALTQLGLAEREGTRTWRTTARGATCRFETGPDRPRRTQEPGPSSQRLLDLLDRPMTGGVIAEKLGVTRQRVRQG